VTAKDLSVLLVELAGSNKELLGQLELLNVAVEQCAPQDLEALLPLVEPDLVVHNGSARVEASLEVLRKLNPSSPTRLLIIAARDELPQLRKLDRKVVISLVATDISARVVASRVAMLAKKCQASATSSLGASKPASLPLTAATSRPAESQDDEDTADLQFVGTISSSMPTLPPPSLPGPRVVVCGGTKAQRRDLERFLGARAPGVLGTSLSVTETDWAKIRSFAPNYFVVDSPGLEKDAGVWLDMLKADKDFAEDQLVTLSFDDLFDGPHLDTQKTEIHLVTLLRELPTTERGEVRDEDRITIESTFERPTVSRAPSFPGDGYPITNDAAPVQVLAPPHPSPFPEPAAPSIGSEKRRMIGVIGLGLGITGAFVVAGALWVMTSQPADDDREGAKAHDASVAQLAKDTQSRAPLNAPDKVIPEDDEPQPAEPDNLWVAPPRKSLPTCDELIADEEALKLGGMAQAKLSWSGAKTALMRGELGRAQLLMCEAVTIYPESLAWEGLIDLAITQGAPQSASLWVSRALALRGERGRTLLLVGDIQSQLGQTKTALASWAQALGVDPTDSETLRQVGAQYRVEASAKMKSGDWANADRLLRRAATLDPNDAEALAGLAACRWALQDLTQAKAWADQALKLDAGQAEALVVLADMSLANNQPAEAKKLYEKALKRAPSHKHARVQLYKISQLSSTPAESTHTRP